MAFLDFLNSGIGGNTAAQTTPGLMGEGNIVTTPQQPIGPTYGDISRAALQYGSKPGSSGPMLAGQIPQSTVPYGQQKLQPLDPNAPKQSKAMTGQPDSGDDTLGMIAKWFMSLIGAGA